MLLLGIDLGTSSIKISVIEQESRKLLTSVVYPEKETEIFSKNFGWAEQSPNIWWENIKKAILKANATKTYNPKDIGYVGIAYQMHGLVLLDQAGVVLRDSIIWCDSRAVQIGQKAFQDLGSAFLETHLNSPGNFTASKLKWVKEYEPEIYANIKHVLLPGDFVSYKFTGDYNTTRSALSEGVFWDFEKQQVSQTLLDYYGFDNSLIPEVHNVFDDHGQIISSLAEELGLNTQVKVTYKAGDQPNNALSLNVLNPGEVAATAGTSGVIYGVSDQLVYDKQSRINTFSHVNDENTQLRTGVLLCINGTGILNSWVRKIAGENLTYSEINAVAEQAVVGSEGLRVLPFGNGAERMLNDKLLQAHVSDIDFNRHGKKEFFRAVQEGIAFAFRYGLDIMRENKMSPSVIRAGYANLFLSPLFAKSFVYSTDTMLELYNNDGSTGAALGAGIGAYVYSKKEAFEKLERIQTIEPSNEETEIYEEFYQDWKEKLKHKLNNV